MPQSPDELATLLGVALARRMRTAGKVRALQRITGGATKRTWGFDWESGGATRRLILQQMAEPPTAPGGPPKLSAEQDAALMTAARAAGVPAPQVHAVLEPRDGLGLILRPAAEHHLRPRRAAHNEQIHHWRDHAGQDGGRDQPTDDHPGKGAIKTGTRESERQETADRRHAGQQHRQETHLAGFLDGVEQRPVRPAGLSGAARWRPRGGRRARGGR